MRIAVISAIQQTPDGNARAALSFMGQTILAKQYDCARVLGAERIICLIAGQEPAVLDLQHRAESEGADFHSISNPLAMVGLVTADDEIVLFSDGIMIERSGILNLLSDRRGILSVTASAGEAAAIERIDAERFWAGLLVAKGDIVAQLADLPQDSDVASLLLRLALQARTPIVELDAENVKSGGLLNIADASSLAEREQLAFSFAIPERPWSGPGSALALKLVGAIGPRVLAKGSAIAAGMVGFGCALSIVLASQNWAIAAILALLLAALAGCALDIVSSLQINLGQSVRRFLSSNIFRALLDMSIVVSMIWINWEEGSPTSLSLVPIALLAIRMAEETAKRVYQVKSHAFIADRVLLTGALAAATAFDRGLLAFALLALAALAYALTVGARTSIR